MPDTLGDPPRFISARGTVETWYDRDLSYRAYARFKQAYYGAATSERPGAHVVPNAQNVRGYLPPTPDMPSMWDLDGVTFRHEVRVLAPDRSQAREHRRIEGVWALTGFRVVTPTRTGLRFAERPGGPLTLRVTRAYKPYPRHDLDAYCYNPHDREALALLQPRCFFHGREPVSAEPSATTLLGRPAELHRLRRIIPLDDPRVLGDEFNPTVFEEAMETEVIVDRERGVVLEWRGLHEGSVFERHAFTEIAFDEPMDPAEFDREVAPGDGRREHSVHGRSAGPDAA